MPTVFDGLLYCSTTKLILFFFSSSGIVSSDKVCAHPSMYPHVSYIDNEKKLRKKNNTIYTNMASGITKEQAMKEVTDAGFPPLAAWDLMTPAVSLFVKKEVVMRGALDYITPMELQVIYTAVSATNNCELSSFPRWA